MAEEHKEATTSPSSFASPSIATPAHQKRYHLEDTEDEELGKFSVISLKRNLRPSKGEPASSHSKRPFSIFNSRLQNSLINHKSVKTANF